MRWHRVRSGRRSDLRLADACDLAVAAYLLNYARDAPAPGDWCRSLARG